MQLSEIDIDVKNPGLLEVPAGKEVDQLPKSHFEKLIAKKGYEKIIRGLTNLEVWNKNKNPKLSQWASNMADSLKHLQPASEAMQEANVRLQALQKGTKKVLSKTGQFFKDRSGKMLDTAQSAIVAGAVAPVGAGIAQKYTNRPKRKDQKYSSSDVAAIATAMKNKSESYSNKLFEVSNKIEKKLKRPSLTKNLAVGTAVGVAGGAALNGAVTGGLLKGAASKLTGGAIATKLPGWKGALAKGVTHGASALGKVYGGVKGAMYGAPVGTVGGAVKQHLDKKKHIKSLIKSEQLIEALNKIEILTEEGGAKRGRPRKTENPLPAVPKMASKKNTSKAPKSKVDPISAKIQKEIKKSKNTSNYMNNNISNKKVKPKTVVNIEQEQIAKGVKPSKIKKPKEYSQGLRDALNNTKDTIKKTVKNTGQKITSTIGKTKKIASTNQRIFKAGLKGAAVGLGVGVGAVKLHDYIKNKNKEN